MKYHINTSLILQEFIKDCECPLCAIKKLVEENILDQFTHEAVMEDSARQKVNERGFCANHFDMLFSKSNKLGLALQTSTRYNSFYKDLPYPKNTAQAKKTALAIKNKNSTCLICDMLSEHMTRYYMTVAEMFLAEADFPKMLNSTKGFCAEHFGELLYYSSYAGRSSKEYIAMLVRLQNENNIRLMGELKWFCDVHDYRNRGKPLGNSADILPRMRIKMYGEKKD